MSAKSGNDWPTKKIKFMNTYVNAPGSIAPNIIKRYNKRITKDGIAELKTRLTDLQRIRLNQVLQVIDDYRTLEDRTDTLHELGIMYIHEVACGSGGVGNIFERRHGSVYVQISCGHGRWNYACVAVL